MAPLISPFISIHQNKKRRNFEMQQRIIEENKKRNFEMQQRIIEENKKREEKKEDGKN